jgi:hypothetical protein
MFMAAAGTAGTTTGGTVKAGIGAAISFAAAMAMAAVSAFGAGAAAATSAAEALSFGGARISDAVTGATSVAAPAVTFEAGVGMSDAAVAALP